MNSRLSAARRHLHRLGTHLPKGGPRRTVARVACGLRPTTPAAHPVRADNPIVQTIYTAGPAPLVSNDRLYLTSGPTRTAPPGSP